MLLIPSVVESTLKLIGLFIIFIIIIVACFLVTRFVGSQSMGLPRRSNFKVLDMLRLGQNQTLAIVQVGKRYFCIGVSKDNISTICELNEDEFEIVNAGQNGASFNSVFASVLKKKQADTVTEESSENSKDSEENQ